jgi:hypothetical protein
MLGAGQIVGYLRLTPEEAVQLKKMPIYFNFSTGFSRFPPHDGTDYLKVAVHGVGYTRNNEKANVSSPPTNSVAARATAPASPASTTMGEKLVAPADSLMANTPWCWTEPLQFINIESLGYPESESTMGNVDRFSTWWDFGNL